MIVRSNCAWRPWTCSAALCPFNSSPATFFTWSFAATSTSLSPAPLTSFLPLPRVFFPPAPRYCPVEAARRVSCSVLTALSGRGDPATSRRASIPQATSNQQPSASRPLDFRSLATQHHPPSCKCGQSRLCTESCIAPAISLAYCFTFVPRHPPRQHNRSTRHARSLSQQLSSQFFHTTHKTINSTLIAPNAHCLRYATPPSAATLAVSACAVTLC